MPWDLSCPDWRERLAAGRSLVPDLPFTPAQRARADRAVAIFNELRLADVPGTPRMAEACGDWFRDIVRAQAGSIDPLTGKRIIEEFGILIPKKNSKTTGGASLMLTALLMNERPNCKFIQVGPTHDAAEVAFQQITGAIGLSPALRDRMHVQTHLKRVTDLKTRAFLEVMSFDPKVLTGQKHNGALIDELHVLGSMRQGQSAIGQLRGGMASYPESFLFFITTQSEKPPAGAFRTELNKWRRIRDGHVAGGKTLPVLYEFPEHVVSGHRRGEELWRRNRQIWSMVTPNLDRSISMERLETDYATARESGEEEVLRWASQHLNVEIGAGLNADSWAGAEYWADCADSKLTLESLLARCDIVTIGLDGGGADDLLGGCVLGRDRVTGHYCAWFFAWCLEKALERRKSEAARLRDFAADGDLVIHPRPGADVADIVALIRPIYASGHLAGVGVDPVGIGAVKQAVDEADLTRDGRSVADDPANSIFVGVSQGYRLQGVIKDVERWLAAGHLAHGGQPMMDWVIANARTELRGNNALLTKAASGVGKIDPLIALMNAASLMLDDPQPIGGCVYTADRGLVVFG